MASPQCVISKTVSDPVSTNTTLWYATISLAVMGGLINDETNNIYKRDVGIVDPQKRGDASSSSSSYPVEALSWFSSISTAFK